MKRCFIALNLPQHIKDEFKKIQADLKQQNQGIQIAWVKPEIAHINLHFLGELEEKAITGLKDNLRGLEGNFGPISLVLTGTGAFPGLKNPRVLFLGIKQVGENKLIQLYQEIGKILNQQKIPAEQKPFIAHITLGRIKPTNQAIKLIGEEMQDIEFRINSFELMESILAPNGPVYKTIKSYAL